jgi:hypothetical protein
MTLNPETSTGHLHIIPTKAIFALVQINLRGGFAAM